MQPWLMVISHQWTSQWHSVSEMHCTILPLFDCIKLGPVFQPHTILTDTRRVRPPNGGRLHEPPSPVSTARPMWLTSGRISHEVVYAGRRGGGPQAGAGPAPACRPARACAGPCTLEPSHWLKLLPQYVNALSPPIAGERVGVGSEAWRSSSSSSSSSRTRQI